MNLGPSEPVKEDIFRSGPGLFRFRFKSILVEVENRFDKNQPHSLAGGMKGGNSQLSQLELVFRR